MQEFDRFQLVHSINKIDKTLNITDLLSLEYEELDGLYKQMIQVGESHENSSTF